MSLAAATGTYNAHGVPKTLTMEYLLKECKSVTGSDAHFTWYQTNHPNDELKAGLDRDKERALLYKWHEPR